jgi:hypothetical protein
MSRGQAGIPSGRHYNAPYFSALDPENRGQRPARGALSYFRVDPGHGPARNLKLGGEYFTSSRTGGNSQSATGFVFSADPVVAGGQPVVDSNGRIIPNFIPNVSQVTNWRSVQGAQIDLNTLSLYLNDNWKLTDKWSFHPRRAHGAPQVRGHPGGHREPLQHGHRSAPGRDLRT